VFIAFYTLVNGEWQGAFKNTFREDDLGPYYSVASMSGNTAMVGFWNAYDYAGTVLVFEQDNLGGWKKVDDPFVRDINATVGYFGWHVDIDRELACVTDKYNAHLIRREVIKWIQFDKIQMVMMVCAPFQEIG